LTTDMDSSIIIRPVTESDLGRIVELERQIFTDPWSARDIGDFYTEASEPQTEIMQSLFYAAKTASDTSAPGQMSVSDNTVGYICARRVLDEGEILNVAVSPEIRRCGIGRKLMDAAMHELRINGAVSVFLEVRSSNTAARRLYEAIGFKPEAIRKNYYRLPTEDAILMKWTADGGGE